MPILSRLLASLCLASLTAHAAVVRVEITDRTDVAKSAYEILTGKLHFESEPKLPPRPRCSGTSTGATR